MRAHFARRFAPVALALSATLLFAASASAAPALNGIFEVPGIDTNNKIVAGPDGNMWVTVENGTNDVARITPSGEVKEFELENITGATGIAVEGNNLWVSFGTGYAKFSPADPKGTTKKTEPGINGAESLVLGPDGNIWVAANLKVIHFPPSEPNNVTTIEIEKLAPKDIDVAGPLIVVADKGEISRIVTLTTAGVEKDFPIGGGSQGVAGAPSGQIAFSSPEAKPEASGLITPPNPAQSFELLGDPFGVAFGSDQAFWIAQFANGGVTRMATDGTRTFLGGLPKESPRQIAPGPGNTLWVTLDKKEGVVEPSVARISGLEPPVTTPPAVAPQTKIAEGPKGKVRTAGKRARVKFRFSSTTPGATFECALTKVKKLKKGQKAAKPKFKGCKSPKSFSLKPGKYRFWVRAVNAGLVDPTPAKRSFSVVHVRKH